MSIKVSIIVVTYRPGGYLRPCLDSILSQTAQDFEVIVVDNSIKHDYCREIAAGYPIKLYTAEEDLFYGAGLNKGIEMSCGDFVLCLNDDVVLDERFIEEALKGFNIDEKIGMVSGKILRSDREIIDSTGLFLSLWRTARERGYGKKDTGEYEKAGFVFGVNGAAAFYRRKMLEDIRLESGYFDPAFRMFYEDLDLAWRAQKAGWKGYYCPKAVAYHVRGASVRQGDGIDKGLARSYLKDELHFDLIKNRYLTIIRNEGIWSILMYLPFIIFYDLLVFGYILLFKPAFLCKIAKKVFSLK